MGKQIRRKQGIFSLRFVLVYIGMERKIVVVEVKTEIGYICFFWTELTVFT